MSLGGGQTESSGKSQSYTPKQNEYLTKALNVYGPQLGKNTGVYQGNRVAGFTDLQNSTFDFAKNGGFVTTPEQTVNYYKDVIKNPAMKNYNEIVNPSIKEAFSGPGYWGSGRAGAEVKGAQDLADNLNTSWGNLNWDVQQANKDGAAKQYDLGTAQQTQNQKEIDATIAKFAEDNQITDPQNLSILMSLLGMNYSSQKNSSSGWDAKIGTDFSFAPAKK